MFHILSEVLDPETSTTSYYGGKGFLVTDPDLLPADCAPVHGGETFRLRRQYDDNSMIWTHGLTRGEAGSDPVTFKDEAEVYYRREVWAHSRLVEGVYRRLLSYNWTSETFGRGEMTFRLFRSVAEGVIIVAVDCVPFLPCQPEVVIPGAGFVVTVVPRESFSEHIYYGVPLTKKSIYDTSDVMDILFAMGEEAEAQSKAEPGPFTSGEITDFVERAFPGFSHAGFEWVAPKLIFHTWVSIFGTGPPGEGTPLDYVTKIRGKASFLNGQGIPLLLVYSGLNFPPEEEAAMLAALSTTENLLLLKLETDLAEAVPESEYRIRYRPDISFMDLVRLTVILNAPAVISKAKSTCRVRSAFWWNLHLSKGEAIMYNDIDVSWTGECVPAVLAKDGMFSTPLYNPLFSMEGLLKPTTSDEDRTRTLKHSRTMAAGGRATMDYVMSGKAHSEMGEIARRLKVPFDPPIAHGENSLIAVNLSRLGEFRALCSPGSGRLTVDLHTQPSRGYKDGTSDEQYEAHHTSTFLQLFQFMTESYDRSWVRTHPEP